MATPAPLPPPPAENGAVNGGGVGPVGNAAAGQTAAQRLDIMMKESLKKQSERGEVDTRHPLRRIAFSSDAEVVIFQGRFSYFSAFMMCVFVITGFTSLIAMVLSVRNTAIPMISEEISYINAPNPFYGPEKQPNGAQSRKIGQHFQYKMPQTMLFYSLCSASFGLFTVCYFCSYMLVQDLGVNRVREMGIVINKGVDVYLFRAVPIIFMVMVFIAQIVYFTSGIDFVISMIVGAATCMGCSNMGINMNFEGGPRLAHTMNFDLKESINMGIRIGAIGGISAHAMAQLGVVLVWMLVRNANALVGFGCGVSIVAFYTRVGGGIFSKGSDIGSDFVSDMIGEGGDDYNMAGIAEMRKKLDDKDGDGEIDDDINMKKHAIDPNAYIAEEDVGFVTQEEHEMRAAIEKEMEQVLHTMHPVNYLDAIGENIADVGGTSSDLFETMCITLATAVIMGSKAHETPYVGTSIPFNIISTGTIGCSLVSYHVWCHEKHSSARIRMAMRLNLLIVMILVQIGVCFGTFLQWKVFHAITEAKFINYSVITFLGLCSPEVCAFLCEIFTSINFPPVSWLAKNANLGMIQVVLQGLGQGFVSSGIPSVVNIVVQIGAYQLEGFYGLILLACASQACTGWQATIASYGAVANNANRMVHLTTVNEMAHHRANVCATIGTTTAHNGKCVAGQNAFFATTGLLAALMADKYTNMGMDYQKTVGQELSEFTRAGMLSGIVFTMLFLANTLTSCINMAKKLVKFCNGNLAVMPRKDKEFPQTHIIPLKKLTAFATIESFKLTFSPVLNSMAAPLVIGLLFGFKGLLMLVSGGNSVCFSLNMFLVNAGQAWDGARKFILFGMLKDANGNVIGPESEEYDTLEIGEQIGGPLEDLTGPALNNFIKFVAVISFTSSGIYDITPENTWQFGLVMAFASGLTVLFFKFGLAIVIDRIEKYFADRRAAVDFEEGTMLLREIRRKEEEIRKNMTNKDEELELF